MDSSGTDDDLPPSQWSKIPRGAMMGGSVPNATMYGGTDMEVEIQQLEKEAYSSVLRAFKAQSDAISWEKESLITELRKELRLSNDDHRELLGTVNADDVVRGIREWRISGQAVHDQIPRPSVSASRGKQKIAPFLPSHSFAGPTFHPPAATAPNQPSPPTAKRKPMMGPKRQKYISLSQLPSLGPSGSGQSVSEPAATASFDPLIGRKVRTRWPDDNNFHEAVIADCCNAAEGRHALVYERGSANETWKWVNLKEISPEDIQWEGEDPGISHRGSYGGPEHGVNRLVGCDSTPGAGRGLGLTIAQSKTDFPSSQKGKGKKGCDVIQLLHTDALIKEVERIFGATHPDTLEVEKAKKVLKEHEQALVEAIKRLDEMSDGDNGMNCAKLFFHCWLHHKCIWIG